MVSMLNNMCDVKMVLSVIIWNMLDDKFQSFILESLQIMNDTIEKERLSFSVCFMDSSHAFPSETRGSVICIL